MKKDYKYLAGIIDGEGCINISRSNDRQFYLRVVIGSTSQKLVFWLKENFNGSIYFRKTKNDKWKDVWTWRICSKKAAELLRKILPYLIIKKQQTKLAIKFQKTLKYCPVKGVPDNILRQRKEFYNLMKQLNKNA